VFFFQTIKFSKFSKLVNLRIFQSVHSNAVEKNRVLYTLLQYGVETTVDRRQKTHRIMTWIKQVKKTAFIFCFKGSVWLDILVELRVPACLPAVASARRILKIDFALLLNNLKPYKRPIGLK